MKRIIYTQRVDVITSYNERRDAADQRLAIFLSALGFLPLPIPNIPDITLDFTKDTNPCGIFLSGGNSLEKYGGDALERDKTERQLLDWAIINFIPVFGICRGLQFLTDYFGGALKEVKGHVRVRHAVKGQISRKKVNSYHTLAIDKVPKDFDILSKTADGVIEGIAHKKLPIMAIGWHPEREENFALEDIELIKNFFEGNKLQ